MKPERLDQILIRLGYVTEDEIKQALMRQKAHGGRIGSHLIYFKVVTEEQLVHALSFQHNVPGFIAEEHDITKSAVKKLAYEIAQDYLVLPVDFDKATSILTLVVADPGDQEMLTKVRRVFRAGRVDMYVAPERQILHLISEHYRGKKDEARLAQIVELPDLFKDGAQTKRGAKNNNKQEAQSKPNILMVTHSRSLRNFLAPVFEREGFALHVLSDEKDIVDALNAENYQQILVSQEAVGDFSSWVRKGKITNPTTEVTAFSTISGVLLDNPVPYQRITRSLFRTLQMIAELRCNDSGWMPPYVMICNDIKELGRSFGLRRLAVDGAQIAAYLLIPSSSLVQNNIIENIKPRDLSFIDFDKSLEYAKSMHFPWDVQKLLSTFMAVLSGTHALENRAKEEPHDEVVLAAQMLSVVWYHRAVLRGSESPDESVAAAVKTQLRERAGSLANLEVIEAYIRLLEQHHEEAAGAYNQIFIVSNDTEIPHRFSTRLRRAGFHIVDVDGIAEAKHLCDRQPPAAILLDRDSFPEHVLKTAQLFKLNAGVLLYAFTRENEPSLTLDLLDAGFDDVFVPPYDFDIITARISKSLRGLSRKGSAARPGAFTATFKAFSFIDLLQALAQSLKSVHIELTSISGKTADVYLSRGRMVYAKCGRLSGEKAVYEVIGWGDDGTFTVDPEDTHPEPNVSEPNEAILMEGCRLLDESKI